MPTRILILGAGPTGLGAAWRLAELATDDWLLLEAAPQAGGLAASFVREAGGARAAAFSVEHCWDRPLRQAAGGTAGQVLDLFSRGQLPFLPRHGLQQLFAA